MRRSADAAARTGRTTRLRGVLDVLRRESRPTEVPAASLVRTGLRETCERALAEVSVPPQTALELTVEPEGCEALVEAESFEIALQDLVQHAVNRAPGGTVSVRVHGTEEEASVEIVEPGVGAGGAGGEALDEVTVEHARRVARLHGGSLETFAAPPGSGVRLRLQGVRDARGD